MTRVSMPLGWLVVLAVLAASPPQARGEAAEDLYRLYCVQCHGTRGNGEGINQTHGGLAVSPRDHTATADMSKLSDVDLRTVISKGGDAVQKSELMPPFGNTLMKEEVEALVRYLRGLCKCKGPQ